MSRHEITIQVINIQLRARGWKLEAGSRKLEVILRNF
jgi:hypothetical protein